MLKNISIIIPTLNEEKYIWKLLQSIQEQEYSYNLEVIIIDGRSEDNTKKIIGNFKKISFDLRIFDSEKRSVTYQRNLWVKKASYENILYLDADIILPKNFLNNFKDKLWNTDANTLVLVAHLPPHFNLLDYIWLFCMYTFVLWVKYIRPICSGSFMLISKKIHNSIWGFDEKIIVWSDMEYGLRAMKKGAKYKFFFSPYVYANPRRLRKEWRIWLIYKWFRWYMYMVRKGPIYKENKMFEYEFWKYD